MTDSNYVAQYNPSSTTRGWGGGVSGTIIKGTFPRPNWLPAFSQAALAVGMGKPGFPQLPALFLPLRLQKGPTESESDTYSSNVPHPQDPFHLGVLFGARFKELRHGFYFPLH